MNLSYWEIKSWFTKVDFTIVGSSIVGLRCALHLKEKFPKSNTLEIRTNVFNFTTAKLFTATNGFALQLINESVKPARAQVLISKPIKNRHIKGAFHLDKGLLL